MPRVGRGRFPLVLIPSILFCLLFMPPRKAAAPPDPPEAAPSPHPARWAPEQQPAPVHKPERLSELQVAHWFTVMYSVSRVE